MSESSLLQRLKERKLVQWALAYCAGGFVVLQLLDALETALGLTPTIQRAILVLAAIGFFITLILAWYHGEKGRQRVSGPELLMVAALFLVAGVALSMLSGGETASESPETGTSLPYEDDRPSIAVLPFDNLSPDPNDAYFADGMQEEITGRLSGISGIRVISRTSVMQYRDQERTSPEIAEELGVDFIVEGSARLAGDNSRLTVQLIAARRDEHLWSENYDRVISTENLVRVQSEIAQQVAFAVGVTLTPEERDLVGRVLTDDTEAYFLYLQGNEAFLVERGQGLTGDNYASMGFYEEALELDPGFFFARARLALSLSYTNLDVEELESTRENAEAALSVLPDLPEARLALGRYFLRLGQVQEAGRQFQMTVAENPNFAGGFFELGQLQTRLGDTDAAIESLRRAEELDPKNPVIARSQMQTFILAHKYDDALRANDKHAALYGGGYPIYYRAWIHLLRGSLEDARAAISDLIAVDPSLLILFIPERAHDVIFRFMTEEERSAVLSAYESVRTGSCQNFFNYCWRKAVSEDLRRGGDGARVYWDSLAMRPTWSEKAVVLLGLGEREASLSAAERAVALAEERMEPVADSRIILSTVLAQFGETDAAIDLLEDLVRPPSWLSVHILEIDPIYDPLRDHPRFQALLERYADGAGR